MRAQRLFPIALSLVLSILMMACKDSPTNPASNNNADALKGTWMLESIDGDNYAEDGTIWTFGDGNSTLTDAETGCRQMFTYTATSTTIYATLTANTCSNQPIGSRDTATWAVSNDRLTMKSGATTTVLRRPSGNDRVYGSWVVTKIDNAALAPGAAMNLYIYGPNFEILTMEVGASQPCLTRFAMSNTGSRLNVEVIQDDCGNVAPGATDSFTWTVNGNSIVLELVGGGLKIEAIRE